MAALYRHPRQTTSIVAIVEGEKDVHTLEALNLRASDGSLIVPTTSGSSSSWSDSAHCAASTFSRMPRIVTDGLMSPHASSVARAASTPVARAV